MNPHVLFWIPAALRLAFVWIGAGIVWYFFGPEIGLTLGLAVMTALIAMQLHYLSQLDIWLDDPATEKMPDGWGAWAAIYARLYRLIREDEKNRDEMSEWLARFRQVMSLLPDGVMIMDDVLFLEWCNPSAEKHLGLSLERDKGMRVTNMVRHPDFINYIILARYEQPLSLTLQDRKLVMQVIPFENRRQIVVTHDVTESDRIDKLRRDFIANASHELRTPLTVVNGFLEIAAAQPELDVETRQSHLNLMKEQGQRMQALVDDMLVLTNLESVDFPLQHERIDMAQLMETIAQEANALSGGKHEILLTVDAPDISGSPDELRTAFSNLAANAVRYTPEHGQIHIFWTMTDAGPRFAVQDTGLGIAPEHIPRLTERFYRVDKGRSRQTKGTGLGLSIVRHVLLRHKATLLISSEVGKGSVFTAQFSKNAMIV
jgi:two-component system phosphate regulon sensor histidine kinase PhoR